MRKITQEEFIARSRTIHGDIYDYSQVKYEGHRHKVIMRCDSHGLFEQKAELHLRGHGCPKCGGTANLSTEDFVTRAKRVHGNKYNYSSTKYISDVHKISVVCSLHGIFNQRPADHLRGVGCPKCGGTAKSNTEEFIKKARQVHCDQYDYSNSMYEVDRKKLSIICPKHGTFSQTPNDHLQGVGCPKCGGTGKLTTEEFINKAKTIHGDKYDYSQVVYVNAHTKVTIVCDQHGGFVQKPHTHTNGTGCPMCKESKGERAIRKFLLSKGVQFESQYKFPDCKNKYPLPFDFAIKLDQGLVLIEYQGEQHYRPISFGGDAQENYRKLKHTDEIKRKYCQQNGYHLVEVPYHSLDKIEELLAL
jgi:Zn finger protein HypA/HybF involved in hydrogenase expression